MRFSMDDRRRTDWLSNLLARHGERAPHDAVNWSELESRIDVQARLAANARSAAARANAETSESSWWGVVASWTRPAILATAAAAVVAFFAMISVGDTVVTTTGTDTTSGREVAISSSGTDAAEALLYGSAQAPIVSRDSLYAALVYSR